MIDDWRDVTPEEPADNIKVLVYTDSCEMKVARRLKGRWDTYLKVTQWMPLPDKPKKREDKNKK